MIKTYIRGMCAIALLTAFFASCATSGADAFLAKNVPPEDRADLLFKAGVEQYNTRLIAQNDIPAIPTVRLYFENVLKIDPMHSQAQTYINKVDSFKATSFKRNLARAQKLESKEKRTEAEDFELALAVQRASDINSFDSNLLKVKFASSTARRSAVQKRVDKLSAIETKILAEKKSLALGKLVPQATKVIAEIESIDHGNSSASSSRKNIDDYIMSLAQKDMDTAQSKLDEKKYGEAETAILRAEKTVSNINPDAATKIQTLKYQIYLRWGNALYTLQKYGPADDKASTAISISRTPEAISLKTKINKASTARDYDAEITEIAAGIDAQIDRGELTGASAAINAAAAKVQKQANKDILAAKREAVIEKMKAVYEEGIAAYNEEDYEGAKAKFRTVIKIDSGYEQAQAYLERTNNKLRALSGAD